MKRLAFLFCITLQAIAMNTPHSHKHAHPWVFKETTHNTRHTYFQCSACTYRNENIERVKQHIKKVIIPKKSTTKTHLTRQALNELGMTLEEFQKANRD